MHQKQYKWITFILLLLTMRATAQTQKERFTDKLYFPFGIGYLNSPHNNLQAGIIVNMAAEYRFHSHHGMFLRLSYDNRSNSYKRDEINGTNITKGKLKFNDFLFGVGYRLNDEHRFHPFALIQFGPSFCEYQQIISSNGTYQIKEKSKTVPVVKLLAGGEYYIGKSAAITLDIGYIWSLKNTPFGQNHLNEGALSISIGLTTTLL
ncbi:outer membrane beta-barrel protein [uncultured Bacteroides sp.]|uniref:outer membrane beta-barrel protein n=1 Tax=uncultured Bacteroides sp. TaxID=162156 RepID=UPI002AABBDA5|nr:outer membrane beta-barrel protein [uncultured Bacteroides sp.]